MSGWGSGYVTDVTYLTGYFRHQSPSLLSAACLLGSVERSLPAHDEPISYLELGCGRGFTSLLLAASNPSWTVTAIDFNPAHVATARAWATKARLDNIRILEADVSTLAEDPAAAEVPEADFVSMHGVWSWVPPSVQDGIVRLLRQKVKAGGAVHVSYNALPAWGPALGMQRIVREGGKRLAARSDKQAAEGLKLVQELRGADAYQLVRSVWLKSLIERAAELPTSYLAHEYMNDFWAPCFHADVAKALQGNNAKNLIILVGRKKDLNSKGEFVDPWGTPLRIYFAGEGILVRSAGPNKRFDDSTVLNQDDYYRSN